MKIHCKCYQCGKDSSLNITAHSRQELSQKLGNSFSLKCSHCNVQNIILVNNVVAVPSSFTIPISAGIGGLIGIIAGPIGVGIGLLLGGGAGTAVKSKDRMAVERFNNSFA